VLARTIGGDAAWKDEFLDATLFAIGFRDGFHHAGRAPHVDLPHALQVENSGTHLVQNKGQVDHSHRADLLQQVNQLHTGLFFAQVHANKTKGVVSFRRVDVDADD
jgi:hypothetical protein